jgi:hypothetical protein
MRSSFGSEANRNIPKKKEKKKGKSITHVRRKTVDCWSVAVDVD